MYGCMDVCCEERRRRGIHSAFCGIYRIATHSMLRREHWMGLYRFDSGLHRQEGAVFLLFCGSPVTCCVFCVV